MLAGGQGGITEWLYPPGRMDSSLKFIHRYHIAGNAYIIHKTQCKMKTWGSMFKIYKNFKMAMTESLSTPRTTLHAQVTHSRSQLTPGLEITPSPNHNAEKESPNGLALLLLTLNKDNHKQNLEISSFTPTLPQKVNLMKPKPIWKKNLILVSRHKNIQLLWHKYKKEQKI